MDNALQSELNKAVRAATAYAADHLRVDAGRMKRREIDVVLFQDAADAYYGYMLAAVAASPTLDKAARAGEIRVPEFQIVYEKVPVVAGQPTDLRISTPGDAGRAQAAKAAAPAADLVKVVRHRMGFAADGSATSVQTEEMVPRSEAEKMLSALEPAPKPQYTVDQMVGGGEIVRPVPFDHSAPGVFRGTALDDPNR